MDFKKYYSILFNAITDANNYIEKANKILKDVQLETEKMYMSETENTKIVLCFDDEINQDKTNNEE